MAPDRLSRSGRIELTLGLLALVGTGAGCSAELGATPARESQGSQVIEDGAVELVHDFGVVLPQAKHSHSFTVRNTSAKPWTLASIRSGCTCTVAKVSNEII